MRFLDALIFEIFWKMFIFEPCLISKKCKKKSFWRHATHEAWSSPWSSTCSSHWYSNFFGYSTNKSLRHAYFRNNAYLKMLIHAYFRAMLIFKKVLFIARIRWFYLIMSRIRKLSERNYFQEGEDPIIDFNFCTLHLIIQKLHLLSVFLYPNNLAFFFFGSICKSYPS